MEARARALMEQRESERAQFADQMLYRQWREGCDGVRAGDSHAIAVATNDKRVAQVEEKVAARALVEQEKHEYDAMYERERLKKEKRYVMVGRCRLALSNAR